MPLSREEVVHIATLCRMGLSEQEVEGFRQQLSDILEQFEVLQEVDTAEIEPTGHSVALESVMREDEPRASSDKEETLANAPVREDNYFRVKAVLEEEGA
jgi:aspartyl-tRNA(Asn)/glutamyl-tRNA(Gln) amidotransferase subunit C